MEPTLQLEDDLQLAQLRIELEKFSKEELIERVLEEREESLLRERYYRSLLESEGYEVAEEADVTLAFPQSLEQAIEIFGHPPTNEELADYCNRRIEDHQRAAMMDVDIEAIALGWEDQG
jgi:hypothetical protein